jgi:hypothetical protein
MESKTAKYEKELLDVIKDKKIAFLDHAFGYTSFSRATGYNHELDKLDSIKAAIGENRVKAKNYMINKWVASDNPTLQIAAFRLMSDTEEHRKLNQSYIDHTSKGKELNLPEWINDGGKP